MDRSSPEETYATFSQTGRFVLSVKVQDVRQSFVEVKGRGQPARVAHEVSVQARVTGSKPGREDEEEEGESFFRLPNVRVAHLSEPVAMVTAADISHEAECLIYYNVFFKTAFRS
jgi:hypothetical protein